MREWASGVGCGRVGCGQMDRGARGVGREPGRVGVLPTTSFSAVQGPSPRQAEIRICVLKKTKLFSGKLPPPGGVVSLLIIQLVRKEEDEDKEITVY